MLATIIAIIIRLMNQVRVGSHSLIPADTRVVAELTRLEPSGLCFSASLAFCLPFCPMVICSSVLRTQNLVPCPLSRIGFCFLLVGSSICCSTSSPEPWVPAPDSDWQAFSASNHSKHETPPLFPLFGAGAANIEELARRISIAGVNIPR